jgi:predicted RNA-binding protein with PIN domain
MKILVDGYNLLHASGIFGGVRGAGGFEASRRALLDEIARLLGPAAAGVVVIFDAADAPPGLPDRSVHAGISVRFARGYDSADALIEELIEDHNAPTALTVVSSDNRVIAAARRRRARPVPSGEWLAGLLAAARAAGGQQDAKPPEPGAEGAAYWKDYFGL